MAHPPSDLEEVNLRLNLVSRALIAGEITDAVAHVVRQCLKDASAAIRDLSGQTLGDDQLQTMSDEELQRALKAVG